MRNVEYIVEKLVTDVVKKKELLEQIWAASDFLKYSYLAMLDESDDPVVNTQLALVGTSGKHDEIQPVHDPKTKIDNCLKPFQVM